MTIKGSKTEKNLLKAFAGESQARNRYTFFASVARKEGYIQIQRIFEETAANEKEHAEVIVCKSSFFVRMTRVTLMTVPLHTSCFVLYWVDIPSCDSVILTRIHLSLPLTKRVQHNVLCHPCQYNMGSKTNFRGRFTSIN